MKKLTVGDLREWMKDVSDDAEIFIGKNMGPPNGGFVLFEAIGLLDPDEDSSGRLIIVTSEKEVGTADVMNCAAFGSRP